MTLMVKLPLSREIGGLIFTFERATCMPREERVRAEARGFPCPGKQWFIRAGSASYESQRVGICSHNILCEGLPFDLAAFECDVRTKTQIKRILDRGIKHAERVALREAIGLNAESTEMDGHPIFKVAGDPITAGPGKDLYTLKIEGLTLAQAVDGYKAVQILKAGGSLINADVIKVRGV